MSDGFDGHVRKGVVTNFVANLVINAAIAWFLLRGHAELTTWGAASYGPDLLITGFLLSVIVAAIVLETHRRQAARGELVPPAGVSDWLGRAAGTSRVAVALGFGVAGVLTGAALLGVLSSTVDAVSPSAYAGIKGVWAGLLAAWIVRPAATIGARQGATGLPAADLA